MCLIPSSMELRLTYDTAMPSPKSTWMNVLCTSPWKTARHQRKGKSVLGYFYSRGWVVLVSGSGTEAAWLSPTAGRICLCLTESWWHSLADRHLLRWMFSKPEGHRQSKVSRFGKWSVWLSFPIWYSMPLKALFIVLWHKKRKEKKRKNERKERFTLSLK